MSHHLYRALQETDGDLITDAVVHVYNPGTTTPISETMYSDSAASVTRANPFSATTGYADFYLALPKVVRLGVVRGSDPEVFFEDVSVGPVLPPDPNPVVITTITIPGNLATGLTHLKHYVEDASDILYIRAAVGTVPTGANAVVDVLSNGTSVFSTTAHAPTFVDGVGAPVLIPDSSIDTDTISAASYFTLNVVSIGSTIPGADLVVKIATQKS